MRGGIPTKNKMHNEQCTMHNVQCAMHNAQCTVPKTGFVNMIIQPMLSHSGSDSCCGLAWPRLVHVYLMCGMVDC